MVLDEAKSHLGGPRRSMPIAFFKMSRSIWARSRSRRRRRISACSADATTAAGDPTVSSACAAALFTMPRQLRSIEGWIPNSVAT
jgi:hypothetical protein